MTPLFPAQRAAEEFDQALGGHATPAVAARYADLLEAVEVLRAQPELLPRAEFTDELRARLMTAAATELVAAPSVVRHLEPARVTRNRRLGTVAASLVIVGGSAGMAAAAGGSLPGESLYPVKRGLEEVSSAMRLSDAQKGRVGLDHAATRLDEVAELQARPDASPALVSATLESFRSDAAAGSAALFRSYADNGDAASITVVRTFTTEQMAGIAALAEISDAAIRAELLSAADTLADIDLQARGLCGGCGPEGAVVPPQGVAAAAGAAAIDNLLARPVAQAQADISTLEAAQVDQLRRDAARAEQKAGEIPQAPETAPPGTVAGSGGAVTREPVTSTITREGKMVPTLPVTENSVQGLVSGVTASVKTAPSVAVPKTKTPIDKAAEDLKGTVDDLTGKLLP